MTVNLGNDSLLSIDLYRSDRKTLAISVYPSGQVEVRAPLTATDGEIESRIKRRRRWIRRQQQFFEQFKPRTPERQYVSGETHLYLGRQYRLKVTQGPGKHVKLWAGYIEVCLPDTSPHFVKHALNKWYRRQARRHFRQLLATAQGIFQGRLPTEIGLSIREFSKRWGTCHPDGTISLNLDLIRAPRSCIEYVVLHELCHFVVPDHSPKFFKLLEAHMPDWRDRKKLLERRLS